MSLLRLEGKPLAQELRARLRAAVAELSAAERPVPTLAVVLVAGDTASEQYVRRISKGCEGVGIGFQLALLPADTSQVTLNQTIAALSGNPEVHGVLIQMPLPAGLSANEAILQLDYRKDVDGLHPLNAGLLAQGIPQLVPNTPAGGMALLRFYELPVAGKQVAIVGRSNVVGRPMAFLLLAENATVVVCHSRTPDLGAITRQCEVVVSATGKAGLITGDMLMPGAVVVDFGINVLADGTTVGDVEYASAAAIASAITPVPGGTGPVTNMMLLQNVLKAYNEVTSNE